jgi:beta-N-acetylhexosaminidase
VTQRRWLAAVAVGSLLLTSCTAGGSAAHPTTPSSGRSTTSAPSSTPSPTPTTPPPLAWGPTQADLDDASRLVAAMPLEQVAGQVLVARYEGTAPAAAAALVTELHAGGVILMGDNVVDPRQVRATADAVQQAAAADGRTWPAVVAVDQEGGRVARVGEPATEFPTLMTAGAARDAAVTRAAAAASGAELRSMGFTWVFAPDADVTIGPEDPTIGSRSASDDPQVVAGVVQPAVQGYADAGIVAVAKHYPGHGSVTTDSHLGLPVQKASLEQLRARDLVPFDAVVEAGVPVVMMSHIAVEAFEPGVPSSLSPQAYASLRTETGFTGVVVTDALDMAAVTEAYGPGGAAVGALRAGADVLLMPADPRSAYEAIVRAVNSAELSRQRLDDAAARVVALMRYEGARTTPQEPDPSAPPAVGTHGAESYALSLAGLTVVDGACSGPLVNGAVQLVGGTTADRQRFTAAAQAAGVRVGSGAVVRLLGTGQSAGDGDVVVALDAPYGLGSSTARVARIALYGRTPDAFRALVAVLTGAEPARGHLPVAVDGLPPGAGCG